MTVSTGTSNVGLDIARSTSLSGSYSAMGTLLILKHPKITNPALEMTPINSTSKNYIKSRQLGLSEGSMVLVADNNAIEAAYDDLAASTSVFYQITIPTGVTKDNVKFEALVTGVEFPDYDGNAPKPMTFTIVFQPRGEVVGLT